MLINALKGKKTTTIKSIDVIILRTLNNSIIPDGFLLTDPRFPRQVSLLKKSRGDSFAYVRH